MSELSERLKATCPEYCWRLTPKDAEEIMRRVQFVEDVNHISETEGTSIEIVHKNPDFNGQPDCLVILKRDFGSKEDRFPGKNFFECVAAARKAVEALKTK